MLVMLGCELIKIPVFMKRKPHHTRSDGMKWRSGGVEEWRSGADREQRGKADSK